MVIACIDQKKKKKKKTFRTPNLHLQDVSVSEFWVKLLSQISEGKRLRFHCARSADRQAVGLLP